jgi:hypothetical protein
VKQKMVESAAMLIARKAGRNIIVVAFTLAASACSVLQPPNAAGPRSNEPPYPVLLVEDARRREAAIGGLNQLGQQFGPGKAEPRLQPVTATIERLPVGLATPLYLPKVGADPTMNEEETREALRRFINDWRGLIGADPAQLSLVAIVDQPGGAKLASYEQRPFRYPIRGDYGGLQIRLTTDRRVLNVSSSCIPDADRVQAALAGFNARLKWEDVLKQLRDSPIPYTDANGNSLSYRLPVENQTKPGMLVTFVIPSKTRKDALEFHLAWEVELANAPLKTVYIDAINGEFLTTQ